MPRQLYTDQFASAYAEMAEIDPADTPFLALALHLDCSICSDDTCLKRQSRVPCYSTGEIADLGENNDL